MADTTIPSGAAVVAPAVKPETIETYLDVLGKIRSETSAWTAMKSKRFTMAFAVILALGYFGFMILQNSVVLSLPLWGLVAWVATSYLKGQAQVDAAQQAALAILGPGAAENLQAVED